jgi:hypothetical protein
VRTFGSAFVHSIFVSGSQVPGIELPYSLLPKFTAVPLGGLRSDYLLCWHHSRSCTTYLQL